MTMSEKPLPEEARLVGELRARYNKFGTNVRPVLNASGKTIYSQPPKVPTAKGSNGK